MEKKWTVTVEALQKQYKDHTSGSKKKMRKRTTGSKHDAEIHGTAGQTCNYFASDTLPSSWQG